AQRRSVDELLDDVGMALDRFTNVVHNDNVRVIECGRGASFPDEAMNGSGRRTLSVAHHLDRDRALEAGIDSAIHFAHATAADQRFDAVVLNGRRWHWGSGHYNRGFRTFQ